MKVIKKFWAPIFIVCFLFLGYIIGQVRNSIKAEHELETSIDDVSEAVLERSVDTASPIQDSNLSDLSNCDEWGSFNLVFEKSDKTADNPWGFTAGVIDVDDEKCVLLTPNTDVVMYPTKEASTCKINAYIHPWVSDSSDGAGLVIWYLDENDEILGQEEYTVDVNGVKTEIKLDLNSYQGTNHLKILCNNGGNNNDSGDWVVTEKK